MQGFWPFFIDFLALIIPYLARKVSSYAGSRDYSVHINYYFVAELQNEQLINITELTPEDYDFISGYKHLELCGFTSKAKKWSGLKYNGYNLSNIESTTVRLSDYIK